MVQLKTSLEWKWGQTNILPLLGEIKISEEGFIEAPDKETADQIEAMDIGFYILREEIITIEDPIKHQTEESDLHKTEEDDLGDSDEDEQLSSLSESSQEEVNGEISEVEELSVETKELHAELDKLTIAQLKEQAKVFPSGEWRLLNKEQLLAYLKTKLK